MAPMDDRDKTYIVLILLTLFVLCVLNYIFNIQEDIKKLQKAVTELREKGD